MEAAQSQRAVEKVLHTDSFRIHNGREIHFLIPLGQQFRVAFQRGSLILGRGNFIRRKQLQQLFRKFRHSCSPSPPRCASQMSSTEISAGLTPLIRDACPTEAGRIFLSFSLASMRSP